MVKQAMINYIQNDPFDEFFTPEKAITPLLPYIPPRWTIWECTDPGNSNISKILKGRGNKVISTHPDTGFDFLTDTPDFDYDCIITNPPYSKKDQFLKKAYELGKPFAMLLPVDAIASIKRVELFKKYGLEILVMDRRINFMPDKNKVWFNVAWFCWNILPSKLEFVQLPK